MFSGVFAVQGQYLWLRASPVCLGSTVQTLALPPHLVPAALGSTAQQDPEPPCQIIMQQEIMKQVIITTSTLIRCSSSGLQQNCEMSLGPRGEV